ncbi:plasmid partitioning protein RepA [Ensifer sp. Root31]|uniref:plasmid partitioning protein RepA n=1 Tax=Ensifer sp. Root31 TaxID=1736512 RepID=UPI00070D582F|nr:plasmid partitioning protein RepA [Ensifer sp. Root31]KQU85477.1 plasmid partitioning protein RepA [Ensifer sp. Root31]
MNAFSKPSPVDFDGKILLQGAEISRRLDQLQREKPPQVGKKMLRVFSMAEVAHYLGVSPNNLKRLHLEGKGPTPTISGAGRRFYNAEQIRELRFYLDKTGKSDAKKYVPYRKGKDRLQVIAIVNVKAGSGKTTTAAHLSQHLALSGHRVLAVDLDPQATLSALYGLHSGFDKNPSIFDAKPFGEGDASIQDVILPTNFPDLDIIPANLKLQEYQFSTPSVQDTFESQRAFSHVAKALARIDHRYDVVVIDCPPDVGYLTLTALAAATSILITARPQMLDLISMGPSLVMLGNITRAIKPSRVNAEVDWLRYLITCYDPADVTQAQMVGFMHSVLAEEILTNPMIKSQAIFDASLTKQTLYEMERSSLMRGTDDRAISCMDAVNSEIQNLIHRAWGRM